MSSSTKKILSHILYKISSYIMPTKINQYQGIIYSNNNDNLCIYHFIIFINSFLFNLLIKLIYLLFSLFSSLTNEAYSMRWAFSRMLSLFSLV